MQPLQSPWEIGDIHWYHQFFEMGYPWNRYLWSVKRQVDERGPLPPDVWDSDERRLIAQQIERLICDTCWGEPLQFHPADPWIVIGEVEAGDLSEVELLTAIEETFELKLPPDKRFGKLLECGWTYGDMVVHIEGQQTSRSKGCA
jgi:hypothetical protein